IAFIGLFIAPTVFGATLVVDTTNDSDNSGVECSLRDAINAINSGAPVSTCTDTSSDGFGVNDRIHFDIRGGGVHTITAMSGLPALTQPVIIDGTTQPGGASCGALQDLSDRNLLITIETANGFTIQGNADGTRIEGLNIVSGGAGTGGNGIYVDNSISSVDNIGIRCNNIGTDRIGQIKHTADFNNNIDIGNIANTFLMSNITIGGPNIGDTNIISGAACEGIRLNSGVNNLWIQNNRIGTDVTGLLPIPNGEEGIDSDSATQVSFSGVYIHDNIISYNGPVDNRVGGCGFGNNAESGLRLSGSVFPGVSMSDVEIINNIFSHNTSGGIDLSDVQNITITNNRIGVDATGLSLASNNGGILLMNVSDIAITNNTIANELGSDFFSTGIMILPDFTGGTFNPSTNITIEDNNIGVGSDGVTLLESGAISINIIGADNTLIRNNTIYGASDTGVALFSFPAPTALQNIAILGNRIFGITSGLAIDFAADTIGDLQPDTLIGPNLNDIGDTDEGPNAVVDPRNNMNHLLNSPVIYDATTTGGDTTINFFLDVPQGDYRIEFFRNSTFPTATLHGPGEEYLGHVDITHNGTGVEIFSHLLLGVTSGDIISTTNTERNVATPSTFGSTSEFGNTVIVASFGPDFGDAPDSYSTLATSNGPYHLIDINVYLGSCVDADDGTLTNSTATADDITSSSKSTGNCAPGQNDEDGVTFPSVMNWGEEQANHHRSISRRSAQCMD
ncbi:MAG: right-handed parallel beta-helix repeat-containing protein, partial [Candidatus Pacebacteria bacterium]|nr:right-handed parallel beta-helix repeat-containing protein [Candidatus Paceibacterota bacterium]